MVRRMYCIDASVFVSAQLPFEHLSKESNTFLRSIEKKGERVFLPEILIPEIASALFRVTNDGVFVSRYIKSLRSVPNFSYVSLDSHLADLAGWLITKTGLRGADAIYVGLAFYYNLTLITLDKDQIKKSRSFVEANIPQ